MWCSIIKYLYFTMALQYSLSCPCNSSSKINQKGEIKNKSDNRKRQIGFEDYNSTELVNENAKGDDAEISGLLFNNKVKGELSNKDTMSKIEHTTTKLSTLDVHTTAKTNLTTEFELDISYITDETATTEPNLNVEISVECKKFKNTGLFYINKMANVWKIVYYTMSTKLKCFSILIRSITIQEQRHYEKCYGDFNGTVLWNKCYLEITSHDNNKIGFNRKHFLQGTAFEQGVMKNIIIDEERSSNMTSITLQNETSDQWLVIKNLLLMRDCEYGHLAVFTKVPFDANMKDIESALKIFGENKPLNGTQACS